jgi:hypothetical protein
MDKETEARIENQIRKEVGFLVDGIPHTLSDATIFTIMAILRINLNHPSKEAK